MTNVTLTLVLIAALLGPHAVRAEEYSYNPINKVDPFQPISLRKPNIRGVSRLQDYEISELELVGTVMGAEITALILTPDPREGILAKIGDRVGRKNGRIIAIARDKIVVREQIQGLVVPGRSQKFNDVTMVLASRDSSHKKSLDIGKGAKDSEALGFPNLGNNAGGGASSVLPGSPSAAAPSVPTQQSQPSFQSNPGAPIAPVAPGVGAPPMASGGFPPTR